MATENRDISHDTAPLISAARVCIKLCKHTYCVQIGFLNFLAQHAKRSGTDYKGGKIELNHIKNIRKQKSYTSYHSAFPNIQINAPSNNSLREGLTFIESFIP